VAKAISVLMDADDITDRVGAIRHPALVIRGRRDIPIPFDRSEELARRSARQRTYRRHR
jgi:pimeloyl-ACP methyl ester carboxylesterase